MKKTPDRPPVARAIPHTEAIHGDVRTDYYAWLRNRDDKAVIKYLKDENRYAEEVMEDAGELEKALYHEMSSRVSVNELTVPERMGDYYYYQRKIKGRQYSIHCRKRASFGAKEEVLLDLNLFLPHASYLHLGIFKVSPDQQKLAYSVDLSGGESFRLFVKDLRTGVVLPASIQNTSYWVEWGKDGRTLYYTTLDNANRSYRLYRHRLGEDPVHDTLIYEEKDAAFSLEPYFTKDKEHLLVRVRGNSTSEIRVLVEDDDEPLLDALFPRQPGVHFYAEHREGIFYVLTNHSAINYRIVALPAGTTSLEEGEEILSAREDCIVEDMEIFQGFLGAYEREDGFRRVQIYNFKTGKWSHIRFDEEVYETWRTPNQPYGTDVLRLFYSSPTSPLSIYDYSIRTKKLKFVKQRQVPNYNPALYTTELVHVLAQDGQTEIPVSMVYRKGTQFQGRNPLLLTAYGAYGVVLETAFDPTIFSLLDRGFIYAMAHVRGGGRKGARWHMNGKLLNKKNTFTDFIACAEYLIAEGYTSSDRLCIMGESAGGLLMGAVTNMRPGLFRAVVMKVPFLDVINTMLDSSLPLTVTEFEEWGNPRDKVYYDYIKSYSPYDNIEVKDYPHILLTAGYNDPRVGYWEVAKFAAKLRAFKTDQNLCLLRTELYSGHSGQMGRYNRLKEAAFIYAFLFMVLGIDGRKIVKGAEKKASHD